MASEAAVESVELRDPAAELEDFEAVVRCYRPAVVRFIMASVRDRDVADSLAQDCFLKAHRARAGFRGECSVHTWLMRIAVNLVRDYGRNRRLQFWKRATASAVDLDRAGEWLPSGDASPEARLAAAEEVRAVWRAAERLPERQRTVFLLRFVEDMELREIAAAAGMKEGTAKVHLSRALEKVREEMRRRA